MTDAQTADLFDRLERIEATLARMSEPKAPDPMAAEWVTTDEAARIMGYKVTTIRTYLCRGLFTARKLGKRQLISRQSINDYLKIDARPSIRERVNQIREQNGKSKI